MTASPGTRNGECLILPDHGGIQDMLWKNVHTMHSQIVNPTELATFWESTEDVEPSGPDQCAAHQRQEQHILLKGDSSWNLIPPPKQFTCTNNGLRSGSPDYTQQATRAQLLQCKAAL